MSDVDGLMTADPKIVKKCKATQRSIIHRSN